MSLSYISPLLQEFSSWIDQERHAAVAVIKVNTTVLPLIKCAEKYT